MDKGLKWLGVCILLSAIVVSGASIYKAKINIDNREKEVEERYIFKVPENTFTIVDKETGTIYYRWSDKFIECNPITKVYKETKVK